jgi:hypothetical protein
MERRSIFFDEWIRSLREQYKYVVRNNDKVTLPSLTAVLHDVGFTDDELAQLRIEATMHVDDVGADYVPDMQILDTPPTTQPHPAECTCPQCIPIDESQFDDEGQPLVNDDPERASHETGHMFTVAKIDAQSDDIDTLEHDTEDIPQTFEDSLVDTPSDDVIDDVSNADTIADNAEDDDPEDNADSPKQISMF